MPQIGEIKKGRDLGYCNPHHSYIWSACVDCGEARWVHYVKGQPESPRCHSCASRLKAVGRTGKRSPFWKGGTKIDKDSYIQVLLQPDDFFYPTAQKNGYVREHRLVVAKALGRNLQPWEIIHHKGIKYPKGSIENKQDNRYPENLALFDTDSEHQKLEGSVRERTVLGRWK